MKTDAFEEATKGHSSSPDERLDVSDREGASAVEGRFECSLVCLLWWSAAAESLEENVLRLARLTDEIQSLMRKPASTPPIQSETLENEEDSQEKDSPRYVEDWTASSVGKGTTAHVNDGS